MMRVTQKIDEELHDQRDDAPQRHVEQVHALRDRIGERDHETEIAPERLLAAAMLPCRISAISRYGVIQM